MKAAWPVESAKYARAAGFAFVFLLFINACIYLLFSPRIEKGGGRGWEPGGRQTGRLVNCLPPLLKAQRGILFNFINLFLKFVFILLFKAHLEVAPCPVWKLHHAQHPPSLYPCQGLLFLAAASQPKPQPQAAQGLDGHLSHISLSCLGCRGGSGSARVTALLLGSAHAAKTAACEQ